MIKDMTEDQMKELINGLAGELVKRIYGVQNLREDETTWYADRDDDHAVGELARLMTLLNLYEDREEYEKCAQVKKHLDKVNKIIEKL